VSAAYLHRLDVSGSGILVLLSHGVGEVIRSCGGGSELISEREKFSMREYQQLRSMGR
jgi:hypothetical protein